MKTTPMILRFFVLFFALALSINTWAKVTAEVEPTQVRVGETFRLIFSSDKTFNDGVPDFSPLEKSFNILGSGKRSQVSVVNGQVSTTVQWVLTMIARKPGKLLIPALSLGKQRSEPLFIQVSSQATTEKKTIFMTVSVDDKAPYVQSQVIYTMKLYYAKRLSRGNLKPPMAKDSDVFPLGKGRSYQAQKNGRLYQVLEQNFAIFPQKSGPLTITSPVLTGSIERTNLSRIDHLFDDVQRPIHLSAKDINLRVGAIPKAFTGDDWLPASDLSLDQQWTGVGGKIRVGEPITREVTLQGKGITAGQLPDLKFSAADIKVYPDKAQTSSEFREGNLVSTKTFKVTYIPSSEGNVTIPAIKLAWWNVKKNRLMNARLSGKKLTIIGNAASSKRPSVAATVNTQLPVKNLNLPAETEAPRSKLWIAVLILLIIWLVTLVGWRLTHLKHNQAPEKKTKKNLKLGLGLKRALKLACMAGEAQQVQILLCQLADKENPESAPHNLGDISKNASASMQDEIEKLQASLYGKESEWSGRSLWEAYLEASPRAAKKNKDDPLEPLNPA